MAPVKAHIQKSREDAARYVARLTTTNSIDCEENDLEALSITKGLFTRTYLQDQWDWFTVWSQLGRPGQNRARRISENLKNLRVGLKNSDLTACEESRNILQQLNFQRSINAYLSNHLEDSPLGQIYVLSTREARTLLKIGYTDRRVEERVKEINASTGVLIPYGVRAVWNVSAARNVEKEVHALLGEFRVRADREFFEMDFKIAFKMIRDFVYSRKLDEGLEN